ncbi:alkylated DNA repair protein AlkB [Tanacetum coccineum]
MSGNNRQSNPKSDNNKGKQMHTCFRIESEPIPKITSDGSTVGASGSEKDKSPLNEKSAVEDVSFGNLEFKQTLNLLDEDSVSKKPEIISHESQEKKRFDICHKSISKAVKLKPPTAVINREKRNQLNRSKQGQNIIMLRSGMVLMKGYISFNDQVSIVKKCRELGLSDGGFYQPGYRDGTKLHLKMMCLGKNWDPESKLYSDTRPSDNAKLPGIPDIFSDMVKKAIRDSNTYLEENIPKAYAGQLIPSMSPDICIVNFYTASGKLGLHQDKDESPKTLKQGLPVVSFSIGDSAEFLYGDDRDIDKADKVILESGDVLIFGGKSRLVFHGVTSIIPKTAPISLLDATDMIPGRLNLTFRRFLDGRSRCEAIAERIIEVTNRVNHRIDNVRGVILAKVVDYCRIHVISMNDAEALKLFDQEFVRNVDEVGMMYLTHAAMDFEIKSLLELCYLALIDKLKAKPLHEIADMFLGFVNLLIACIVN